jgi:hemoglobin-like flavoprotein
MEIHDSIEEILQAKDELGAMFYEHFLTSYPEVQRHFQSVDLKRQSILLVTALMIVERHASRPTPATELYLKHLGTRHHDLQVPKDVYGIWVKAMLETMQLFHGEDWTSQLEDRWRQAFEQAIEIMFHGYDQRVII